MQGMAAAEYIAALDNIYNGTKMFDTKIKASDPLMDGVV